MLTEQLIYNDGDLRCEGMIALPDNHSAKKNPAVMVVHDWTGRNAFAEEKIKKLAALGYVGFAVDMYGEGRTGKNNEEKNALIQPLMSDRKILRKRLAVALAALKNNNKVDVTKIAIMGFCFGGLCALELARSGADIVGAISVHGLLHADPHIPNASRITAKILALHGFDDPMVKPDLAIAFSNEMTAAGADWQLHVFGNTMHAFTNPLANDKSFGTVYNASADKRSWISIQNFLNEIFK